MATSAMKPDLVACDGAVTVSVKAFSDSEHHANHCFAPMGAYKRLASFFPKQAAGAKESHRRNRSCFFGRSQSPTPCEAKGHLRSNSVAVPSPSPTNTQMKSPQSLADSACSSSSAADMLDVSPEVQTYDLVATRFEEPGFVTPPRRGRIHHAGHRRDKSLRTVGGELIDGDPDRDLQLVIDETGETPPVLTAVSSLLDCLLGHSQGSWEKMLPKASEGSYCATSATVFYGKCIPPISLHDYVVRMHKYGHCSPAAFLYAVVYMDRLVDKYGPSLAPNRFNAHRLLLAGVIVAAKFLDDRVFSNAYYARVGGVSTAEMNRMEKELLHLLDFRVMVQNDSLEAYCKALQVFQQTTTEVSETSPRTKCSDAPPAPVKATCSAVTAG